MIVGSVFLAGGCARNQAFIPEAIALEQSPIRITATQLYQEYLSDEAAADAKYKGKKVWVTEARVDSFLESESGCYLIMRWHPGEDLQFEGSGMAGVFLPAFSICTLKLEPQFPEVFKDVPQGYYVDVPVFGEIHVPTGYVVEVVGECRGISEGVVTVKISRIAMIGGGSTLAAVGDW